MDIIIGGISYNHEKYDCPRVLTTVFQQKYKHIPTLGCSIPTDQLMSKLNSGLKKHNLTLNQIYENYTKINNIPKISQILKYLLENKRDGFFVLHHIKPKDIQHIVAFLYNDHINSLDFFDSYNESRTLYTLRLKKNQYKKFINELFHTYFEDEFAVAEVFEIT